MTIAELVKRLPEPALDVVRQIYLAYKGVRSRVFVWADERGLLGPTFFYDDWYFERRLRDPWRADSREVARAIATHFRPRSVIEYGCAVGTSLEYFEENEITAFGVEGNSGAIERAVVPTDQIDRADLRYPYTPPAQFDVVVCIEVAEHIPHSFDDEFVDTLCNSGRIIVFSAAPPGQAGTHHVNCQPREYWIRKFAARGFTYDRSDTADLRNEMDVEYKEWVPANLFVFRDED